MTVDPGSRGWNEHRHIAVPGRIGTADLADGSVTTPKIANLAVTGTKIAAGTITGDKIAATAWTVFTPTLTQGVAITISSGQGRYVQVGKQVIVTVSLTAGSAGSVGGAITLGGLPVGAVQSGSAGVGEFVRSGGPVDTLVAHWSGTTAVIFAGSRSVNNYQGSSPAVTVVSGDVLYCLLIYEAA